MVAPAPKYESNWTESYIFVNHLSRPFIRESLRNLIFSGPNGRRNLQRAPLKKETPRFGGKIFVSTDQRYRKIIACLLVSLFQLSFISWVNWTFPALRPIIFVHEHQTLPRRIPSYYAVEVNCQSIVGCEASWGFIDITYWHCLSKCYRLGITNKENYRVI